MNLARLVRFGIVGIINTAIYYGTYLLLRTQIPYLVAHVCAFCFAMVCSYFLNCYITFRTPPRWKTFALFPLSNVANFVITTFGLRLSVAVFGLDERIAPLPVALIAIPITYVVTHYIMMGPLRALGSAAETPVGAAIPEGTPGSSPNSTIRSTTVAPVADRSAQPTPARRVPRWEAGVVTIWAIVLTALAELFPRSGDDWAWGTREGIDRLHAFFRGINGRYGGDLLIIGLTRVGWLAALVVSLTVCASVVLVLVLADQRTPLGYGVASAAFLAMPVGVWRQSIVWLSGFVNYVVAGLFLLVFLAVAGRDWRERDPAGGRISLAGVAVAGFVGQLFMEHVTLAICGLGVVLTALTWRRHGRAPRHTLTWTLAALAGAAVMFSNSAYRHAASGAGYQKVESGSLKAYAVRLLDYLPTEAVVVNTALNGALAIGLLALVAVRRRELRQLGEPTRAGATWWTTWALRLVPPGALAFLALSWGLWFVERRHHLPHSVRSLATVAALLLILCSVMAAAGLVRSARRQFILLAGVGAAVLMVVPLLVVNPIGPRCFYPTYLALLVVAVTIIAEVADAIPATKRVIVAAPFHLATIGLAVMLAVIYAAIHQGIADRLDQVRTAAREHAATVTVTPLPHSDWVHDGNPYWSLLAARYKRYYGIDSPIVVKVSPNPWLRTPANRHPVSPP